MQIRSRNAVLFVVVAVVVVCALVALRSSPETERNPPPDPEVQKYSDPILTETSEVRPRLEGEEIVVRVPIRGRVSCAATGVPLWSRVQGGATQVTSDPQTGRFEMPASSETIEVSATGYRSTRVKLGEAGQGELEVRLVPEAEVCVSVRNEVGDSEPSVGVRVLKVAARTKWIGGPSDIVPSTESLGSTDAEGRLRIRLGRQVYLQAVKGDRCSIPVRCEPSDGDIVIVLPQTGGRRIGIRRSTDGAAIPGVEVRALRTERGGACPFLLVTGDDGLSVSTLPSGDYRLSILDPYVVLKRGRSGFLDTRITNGGEPVWLVAENKREERAVVVLDAVDGSPIDEAAVILDLKRVEWSTEKTFALMNLQKTRDGRIPFGEPWKSISSTVPARIVVWSRGYLPRIVEDPQNAFPPVGDLEVSLERVERERTLRLIDIEGIPWSGVVAVRETPLGLAHVVGRTGADGVLGPFRWCGGDVEVRICAGKVLARTPLARIPAAVLEDASEILVTVRILGKIRVPILEDAALDVICLDVSGTPYSGIQEEGWLVFNGLPQGKYHVGPQHLIEQMPFLRIRGQAPDPVELGAAQELDLEWDSAWSRPGEIRGRVFALGIDPDQLLVAAIFGPTRMPIRNSWFHPTAVVGKDGSFVFRDLSAYPQRYAVFACTDGVGESLMAVTETDRPLSVECGMLNVEVTGIDRGTEFEVSVLTRPMAPVDVMALVGGVIYAGRAGERMVLGPIPNHVHEIVVVHGKIRKRVPIEILPGRTSSVKVAIE